MLLLTASTTTTDLAVQADTQMVIVERVRGEFREMPGLTLTLAQAGRLWSLDASICSEVLGRLVESGFLHRKADGTFCRASDFSSRQGRLVQS